MTINPPVFLFKNVKLIIGLGNPGTQYENTYHNAGFIAIDYFAQKFQAKTISLSSRHHFVALKTDRFYLAKPTSFMNQSGNATAEIIKFFKIPPAQTLIIHDDSDIELGLYKVSFGRGGAGHNGVQSIIDILKTSAKGGSASGGKNFWRLRLGIRSTPKKPSLRVRLKAGLPAEIKRMKAGDFVLNKIKPTSLKILYSVLGDVIIKLTENEKP